MKGYVAQHAAWYFGFTSSRVWNYAVSMFLFLMCSLNTDKSWLAFKNIVNFYMIWNGMLSLHCRSKTTTRIWTLVQSPGPGETGHHQLLIFTRAAFLNLLWRPAAFGCKQWDPSETFFSSFFWKYIHAYMHTCIHAYMHTCMNTCIHAYTLTYIHAYIHTYNTLPLYQQVGGMGWGKTWQSRRSSSRRSRSSSSTLNILCTD